MSQATDHERNINMGHWIMIAIAPVLIMAMVGSLVFFLIEIFYSGEYSARVCYVFALFTMSTVLISRISIEEGRERATLFAVPLALATLFVSTRFITSEGTIGLISVAINAAFIAVVWWSAAKLTWDCTVVDQSKDVSNQGLIRSATQRLKDLHEAAVGDEQTPASTIEDSSQAKPTQGTSSNEFGLDAKGNPIDETKLQEDSLYGTTSADDSDLNRWWSRFSSGKKKRQNAPGLWVCYFSLAAIPIFGIGQAFIPAANSGARFYVFCLFVVYMMSGLGLLMTTSLFSLQRYLVKRDLVLPNAITTSWVYVGGIFIIGVLSIVWLLPRPAPEYSVLPDSLRLVTSKRVKPSRHGVGNDGKDEAAGGATQSNRESPQAASAGGGKQQSGGSQQGNQSGSSSQQGQGGSGGQGSSRSQNSSNSDSSQRNQSSGQQQSSSQQQGSQQGSRQNSQSADSAGDSRQNSQSQQSNNASSGDSNANSDSSSSQNSSSGNSGSNQNEQGNSNDGRQSGQNGTDEASGNGGSSGDSQQRQGNEQNAGDNSNRGGSGGRSGSPSTEQRNPGNESQNNNGSQGNRSGRGGSQSQGASGSGNSSQENQEESQQDQDGQNRSGGSGRSSAGSNSSQQSSSGNGANSQSFNPLKGMDFAGIGFFLKLMMILILIAIAIFALVRYREAILRGLQQLIDDLQRILANLFGVKKAKKKVAVATDEPTTPKVPPKPFSSFRDPFESDAWRQLSPKQLAIYSFQAFEAWGREKNCPRLETQTPSEYAKQVGRVDREVGEAAKRMAEVYSKLAYAPEVDQSLPNDTMKRFWSTLRQRYVASGV